MRSFKKKQHVTKCGIAVRSGYEKKVIDEAKSRGVKLSYEPDSLAIQLPVIGGECKKCGAVKADICKHATYCIDIRFDGTPDIRYCELKGRLTSKDRTRLKAVFSAWGTRFKLYLLFQRDNKLSKASKTSYTDWARKTGFITTVGNAIPEEWTV